MNKIQLIKTLQDRIDYLFKINQVELIYRTSDINLDRDDVDEIQKVYDKDKKDFIELLKSNIWTLVMSDSINENLNIDVIEQHNEQVSELN